MVCSLSAGRKGRQGEGLLPGLTLRCGRAGRLRPPAKAASEGAVLAAVSTRETSSPLSMAEIVTGWTVLCRQQNAPLAALALCRNTFPVGITYLWLHLQWPWGLPARGRTPAAECLHCYLRDAAGWACLGIPPALGAGDAGGCPGKHCACALRPSHCSRALLGIFCSISLRGDRARWRSVAAGGAWLLAGSSWLMCSRWCNPACGCDHRGWPRSREGRLYLRTESTTWTTHLWPRASAASDARAAPPAERVSLPPCWRWLTLPCF